MSYQNSSNSIKCINNHSAFGNTVQEDLWKALQLQADEESVILPAPIETIMTTWTKQMGYPVVSVTRSYDWTNSAYVKQVNNIQMFKKSFI